MICLQRFEQYEIALGLAREVDRASVPRVLMLLARARLAHGDPQAALTAIEEALAIQREMATDRFAEASALYDLGRAHHELGSFESAAQAL